MGTALGRIAAGLCGLLAVALGAFGAHALEGRLDARGQRLWQLASQYALVHAAVLLAVARFDADKSFVPIASFSLGTAIFSGSLYALALGAPRWLGLFTPIGGCLLLVGWALVAWAGLKAI